MCFRPGGVEDSVLTCPDCGQLNPNIATNCIKCGKSLVGEDGANVGMPAVAAPSAPKAPGVPSAPRRGPSLPGSAPVVPSSDRGEN